MRAFICMDDEECIETIKHLLDEIEMEEDIVVDSYQHYVNMLRMNQKASYDIAFIGDRIDGENGFQMGALLYDACPECFIIYVGDDYSHMHESFRAHGFQMFLKKELKHLLAGEFQRIWKQYRILNQQVIFYLNDGRIRRFMPSEICYIENSRFQTQVVTQHQRYYGQFQDLTRLKAKLLKYSFFQMHPRYFVNMHSILLIRNGELELTNGDCVPTSVMNKELINDAIQSFIYTL